MMERMRSEEKKSKKHVTCSFECGALELSLNGAFISGDKPPKIGDDMLFGFITGVDVVAVFAPPAPLKTLQ